VKVIPAIYPPVPFFQLTTDVTIIPSHPAEGWLSMNRHWQAMNSLTTGSPQAEFKFHCPLRYQELLTSRSNRLHLALEKKILYPARIRMGARSGIAHILDHSYAFLLPHVPRGVKTIVTVHDLLPLRESEGIRQSAVDRFRRRVEFVKTADLILSDSIATKEDLVAIMDVSSEMIQVLPLGVSIPVTTETAGINPYPSVKFLLSVGGYMKRKNLDILPSVLSEVRKSHPSVKLIRVGEQLPAGLVAEFQDLCGADALLELGRISDKDLAALYGSAAATLVPSRYEGFGLPVIEAMARGCPVVCANGTSLPEVGGDVALYHEVDDPMGAAEQILRILDSAPEWLSELKQRGKARAANFSWEVHFERLLAIYREIAPVSH
jgi:glycosyltransferase involved in cell wall biosynthesis